MNSNITEEPGFAPSDLTDGRQPGDWRTRYDGDAKRSIRVEAIYLTAWLVSCVILIALLITGVLEDWVSIPDDGIHYFNISLGAWFSGTLGGTTNSLKWLYHTVAKNTWNLDRRLWRLFTPPLSGIIGLMMVFTVSSGLFGVFDPSSVSNLTFVIALGFLSGYFSDNATAKMSDIAISVFGKTKGHGRE